MTDRNERLLPSSRMPVTEDHPASAGVAAETGRVDGGSADELRDVGGSATWPTVGAVRGADADAPARTATFEDATRFAGATETVSNETTSEISIIDLREPTPASVGRAGRRGRRRAQQGAVASPRGEQGGSGSNTPGDLLNEPADSRITHDASYADATETGSAGATAVPQAAGVSRSPAEASGTNAGVPADPSPENARSTPSQNLPVPTSATNIESAPAATRDVERRPILELPPEPTRKPGRTADEIERDIELSRERLALTIDAINDRVNPSNVAARAKSRARNLVIDPAGNVRLDRVLPAAGAVLALVALRIWRRRRAS